MAVSVELTRSEDELKQRFEALTTPEDVADLLEISYDHLNYILFWGRHFFPYRKFIVRKKSGGFREINAPPKSLCILQAKLNTVLQVVYKRKPSAHGFVTGHSILTNARQHVGARFVLNIDLKDFFPTIHFGRVRGAFMKKPYNVPAPAATVLARLCCHEGSLPQGAPSSPMVSNMVCARLDGELQTLAKRYRCSYTRYADDMTISTTVPKFPRELAAPVTGLSGEGLQLGGELLAVIESNKFDVNPAKQRLQLRDQHQEVTGLTVNKFPNVKRRFIRQIRAMLHAWEKFGLIDAQREFRDKHDRRSRREGSEPSYRRVVRGKLDFLKMVKGENDPTYRNLRNRLHKLDPDIIDELPDQSSIDAVAAGVEYQRPNVASHVAPDGTVTIFFSDIESSTALNVQLRDRKWMILLREHNEIVRRHLRMYRGYEVKTVGDAFMLAFRSAADALRCALAVQREFAERNEAAEIPIRVRIGLHTGEPVLDADDFFGYHVNYASRIESQAAPGEIVVSKLLRDVVAPSGDFELKERKPVTLRGFKGSHITYTVVWANDKEGAFVANRGCLVSLLRRGTSVSPR